MDFHIAVPLDRAEEFKASLFDFLDGLTRSGQDGFAVHSVEPHAEGSIQHVYFESDQAAVEFQSRWSSGLIR